MIDLSIIIVSYNNKKVLVDCLNSIKKYNDIEDRLEVIVVEQSPENEIFNYISRNYPWVRVLRHDNKGFGAGNNVGASIAKAPFLLFLNPDTVLLEPVFSYAIKKFQNDKKLGMFGVQLLDGEKKKNSSFMMQIPYGLVNKAIYKFCNQIGFYNSKRMYIQGADMFIRRNLFEKIGCFDENLFMYCEETDLCIRIYNAGYEIAFDPSKQIIHLEGKSTENTYATIFEKQINSFEYICRKHKLPFRKIMRREYRTQKVKLFACNIIRRDRRDVQNQKVDIVKKYI